ncbi:MAG: hypothetical protein U0800_20205 [Isosphaeraceae bacterium]
MPTVAPVLKELFDKAELRNNCSGFFKALVNDKLKMAMPNLQADGLIEYVTVAGGTWIKVGNGAAAGRQAAEYAAQGYLVVALLKACDHQPHKDGSPYTHGHLAIVLPDSPPADGYPYLIGGSIVVDGRSDGSKRVRGVWRGIDAPNVQYYRSANTYDLLKPSAAEK